AKGIVGVAPEAKLASGMVIEGGQEIERILAGMEWVAEKQARILSMSLGIRGYTTAFQAVIEGLRRNNILPVIAIGNEGPLQTRSPGNYDNVLSVGAMDKDDIVADFSGSQTFERPNDPLVPDLVAPGVDVVSCAPGGRYVQMSGTSMATPHVAGLAALLFQAKSTATVAQVESAIFDSCKLPAEMLQERGNRGVPDGVVAVTNLTGTAPVRLQTAAARQGTKRRASLAKRRAGSRPRRAASAKRHAASARSGAAKKK